VTGNRQQTDLESPWLARPGRPGGVAWIEGEGAPVVAVQPLLTVADVAKLLKIGQRTVWRLSSRAKAGEGRFPRGIRIGRAVRWRWQDVEKYLAQLAGK